MAAEISCLTGVDADDKDADPEINALMLMQEPLRMTSCTDAFSKSLGQPNGVLDVLSSEDMLSPVGLGNGPSVHQPTEAHELNSFSNDKEEEKNITPLKTVQEIGGMWDFDIDSSEESSDDLNSPGNVTWDSPKEVMQFLWDSHGDSPGEEPKEEALSPDRPKRRKRKMDMVVMVDPSEELFPPEEEEEEEIPVIKVQKPRMSPSGNATQYTNGTTKHFINSSSTGKSKLNSINHKLSPLNSYSDTSLEYPCKNCKLVFKKRHLLDFHMKSHTEPYVCKECGKTFKKSGFLIEHMAVHRPKVTVGKKMCNSQMLACPQCSFETKSSIEFVQHAKSHQKELKCDKCNFKSKDACELRKHNVIQHSIPAKKNDEKPSFTCIICSSYRTFSRLVFRKHLLRRHDQSVEMYEAKYGALTHSPTRLIVPTSKSNARNAEYPSKEPIKSEITKVSHPPRSIPLEKKSTSDQWLYCPQCSFGTKCSNQFVQHAKSHLKEKTEKPTDYKCVKCNFKVDSESELRRHTILHHSAPTPKKYEEKLNSTYTCNICCSYKTFSKLVFKKHLMRRHDQTFEEYEADNCGFSNTQKPQSVPTSKSHLRNELTSKISIESKNSTKPFSHSSNNISNLFRNNRRPGLFDIESKLDKSINEFLNWQKESPRSTNQKKETNGITSEKDPYDLPESPLSDNDQMQSENDLDPNYCPKTKIVTIIQNKTYSKRKTTTPFDDSSDEDTLLPESSSPKCEGDEDDDFFEQSDLSPFRDSDNNHDDGIFKRQKQIIYTYSRRMSIRGALQESKKLYEKIKTESDVEIKDEEPDEDLVIENETIRPVSSEQVPATDPERKHCPYCTAEFESGIGLSNHIRGHLHRIGLNHKARHNPVTTTDEKLHIGQGITLMKNKAELQEDTDSLSLKKVHKCPLCGDSFDNRTGQANHIRGHLKKLGKGVTSKLKSPILLLRELMRDKKEYQRALEIIGKNNYVQHKPPSKLSDFRTFPPRSIDSVKDESFDNKPLAPKLSLHISEKDELETNSDIKNNSALIGLLKKRKCQEDGDQYSGSRLLSSLPHSLSEKDGFRRKSCMHCNASFHSGVSLSNHLRACGRRKKNGLPDATAHDGKIRRQQMRPVPKKKILPLSQTPEEKYRLTCRFCDLVFQGPLSVQEDWVKHLQRHIMNTSVPNTGLAMMEVRSAPKDLSTRKHEDGSTSAPC